MLSLVAKHAPAELDQLLHDLKMQPQLQVKMSPTQSASGRKGPSAAGEGPRSPSAAQAPSSTYSFKQRVKEFDGSRRSKMLSRRARKCKERPALPPWDLDISIRSYEGVGPWFGSPTSKQQEMDIPVSVSNMRQLQQVGLDSDVNAASMQRIAAGKPHAKERIVRKASWKRGALLAPKKSHKSLAALGLVARPTQQIAANRRPNDTKSSRGRLVGIMHVTKAAPQASKSSKRVLSPTDQNRKKPQLPESGNQHKADVPSPQENEEDTGCLPLIKTLAEQLIARVDAACTSNSSNEGEVKPFEEMLHAVMPPDSPTSCSRMLQNSQMRQDLSADNVLRCRVPPGACFPRKTDLSELEQAGTTLATSPSAQQASSLLLQRKPDMKGESNQTCGDEPSTNRFNQTYSDVFMIRLPCAREGANQLCISYLGKVEGAALTAGLQIHQVTEEAEGSDPVLGKASKLSQTNPDIYQIKLPNLQRVLRDKDEDANARLRTKEWTSGSKRDPLSVINIYTRQRQTEAQVKGGEPSANLVEQALVSMPSPVSAEAPERPVSYKLSGTNASGEFQSSTETAVTNSSELTHHRTRSPKRHSTPTPLWNKLSVEIRKLKRIRKEWKHDIVSGQLHTDGWMAWSPVGHPPRSLRNTLCEASDVVAMHDSRKHLSLRQETQKMDWLERNVLEKRKEAEELRLKWKRHLLELELQRLDAEIHETRTRIERAVNEQPDSQVMNQQQANRKFENIYGLDGQTQISHAHLDLDEFRQEPGKEGCESVLDTTNYSDSFVSESALQQEKEMSTPAVVVHHTVKQFPYIGNSSWRHDTEVDDLALVEELECEPGSNFSEHDTAPTVSEVSVSTSTSRREVVDDSSSLGSEAIRPAPIQQSSKLESSQLDQESDEALVNEGHRKMLSPTTPDQVREVVGALGDDEQEPFGQSTVLDSTFKLDESSTSTAAVHDEVQVVPTFLEESLEVSHAEIRTFHPSISSPISQPDVPPTAPLEENVRKADLLQPCQGQEVKAAENRFRTFDGVDREAASPDRTWSFSSDFSDFDEEEDEKAAERGQPAFDVSVPEAAQDASEIRPSQPSEEQAHSVEQPAGSSPFGLELDEDIPEEIGIEDLNSSASVAEENDGPEADLTSEGYESDLNFIEKALSNETGTPLAKHLEMGKAMLVEARLERELGKLEQHKVLADRRITDMLFAQDEFQGTNNHRPLGTLKAKDSRHPVRKSSSSMVLKTSSGVSSKSNLWSQEFVQEYVEQLLKLENSGTTEAWDRVAQAMSACASVKHQTMFLDCVKEVIVKQRALSKEVPVHMVTSSIMGYLATSRLPTQEIVKMSCLAHCEDANVVTQPDNHGLTMSALVTDMCDSLLGDMLSDIVQDFW